MTSTESKKITPLAKWIIVGMSVFMCAYGIFIIVTQHYYGYTSKYGGAEVSTGGLEAMMNGVAIIAFGQTPMSLLAKSAKAAGLWAGCCMVLGIILFLAPAYLH